MNIRAGYDPICPPKLHFQTECIGRVLNMLGSIRSTLILVYKVPIILSMPKEGHQLGVSRPDSDKSLQCRTFGPVMSSHYRLGSHDPCRDSSL